MNHTVQALFLTLAERAFAAVTGTAVSGVDNRVIVDNPHLPL